MDMIEYPPRDGSADDVGDGIRREKQRDCVTQLALPKPVRQVQQDSRKIPGLRHTKKKARDVQMRCGLHEPSKNRHQAPADQDARDPAARAKSVEEQIAGYLEHDVPGEKHRRDETVLLAVNAEL